jgi:hypothetical protein
MRRPTWPRLLRGIARLAWTCRIPNGCPSTQQEPAPRSLANTLAKRELKYLQIGKLSAVSKTVTRRLPPGFEFLPPPPDPEAGRSCCFRRIQARGRAPRSHEFGGRMARPTPTERAALADCVEPFIHRKKSLPGLRQKMPANGTTSLEASEYAFAGMCSRRAGPQRRQAARYFPANRPRADARTRTGDPFITRERQVRDARLLAGTRGHFLAGN